MPECRKQNMWRDNNMQGNILQGQNLILDRNQINAHTEVN